MPKYKVVCQETIVFSIFTEAVDPKAALQKVEDGDFSVTDMHDCEHFDREVVSEEAELIT